MRNSRWLYSETITLWASRTDGDEELGCTATCCAKLQVLLRDLSAAKRLMDTTDVAGLLPGAGFNFQDVTSVFIDAAAEMELGGFVFMEDFTLHDAMGALEIGEPRLDSGLIAEGEHCRQFNPLMPLLPQELCWILDRSLSYEMEWHAGNSLSQTVFTLLYVHRLADLDVEYIPSPQIAVDGESLIPELLTVVLRAYVMGLLKCCDLSWRELSKHSVQDTEDWQSEKCDISLLEGLPVKNIITMLEEADNWLMKTTKKIPILWRNALRSRIVLRKVMLQLMHSDAFASTSFHSLINDARQQLILIRSHPVPDLDPESAAHLAFDPRIGGRLKTSVPLRAIPVPTSEKTWQTIDALLDGWQELSLLANTHNLSTWEIVGNIRIWLPDVPPQIPYLRSCTQSVFFDGLLILNKFTSTWVVDRFFYESLGVGYDFLVRTIERYAGEDLNPFAQMERTLYNKLITPHIRGLWLNCPRRRRHLTKSLLDWHALYDMLVCITTKLESTSIPRDHIALHLPKAALIWRLSCIREIVFSGFQLELFSLEERPIAYWYATQVIEAHLACLEDLFHVVPGGSGAYHELQFQHQLLSALQALSMATFVASMSLITFNWSQLRPSFHRRYKWAFRPEYDHLQTPVVAHPELDQLLTACSDILENESYSPAGFVELAECILSDLLRSGNLGGWAGLWAGDRLQFVRSLIDVCKGLHGLPRSAKEVESFDALSLNWDMGKLRWFPSVRAQH